MTVFITPPTFAADQQRSRMRRKKNASQAVSLAPPPVASDYDTDTANYTDHNQQQQQQQQLPLPPPDDRSPAELNILVLKRWYPEVDSIVAIAPFAVVYNFSPDTQQWEKLEIQGTLFVCQLCPLPGTISPRYRVVILNRRNTKNFDMDLLSTESIEVTEEFVIIPLMDETNQTPQIYGIWIYTDSEADVNMREVIANVILECASKAEQGVHQSDVSEQYEYEAAADAYTQSQDAQRPYANEQSGRSVDVAALFAQPAPQLGGYHPQQQPFIPSADTTFFRDSHDSGQQAHTTASQQNALLDLFRNAKKS